MKSIFSNFKRGFKNQLSRRHKILMYGFYLGLLFAEIDNIKYLKQERSFTDAFNKIYEDQFNEFPKKFYEHVIIIMNLDSPFLKHLKLNEIYPDYKKEKFGVLSFKFKINKIDVLNVNEFEDYVEGKEENSLFCITDTKQIRFFRYLKSKKRNVFYFSSLFEDFYFSDKIKQIMSIEEKIKILTQKGLNLNRFNHIGIFENKYPLLDIVALDFLDSDTIKYEFMVFNNNMYTKDNLKYSNILYEVQNIIFKSYYGMENFNTKVEWCDKIINDIFELLLKRFVMRKRINLSVFVELVPLIFPEKVTSFKEKSFTSHEILKIKIDFRNLPKFSNYDEYFYSSYVEQLIEKIPVIVFSLPL